MVGRIGLWMVFLFGTSLVFGQQRVVFYDISLNEVVPKVQVVSKSAGFVGLSNENGAIALEKADFPVECRHFAFEIKTLPSFTDTVYLTPKYQELEEVALKPVNKMELYNEVIAHSSEQIDRSSSSIPGFYFESVMIVNTTAGDTVFLDNFCDLILQKSASKKKIDYAVMAANGMKYFENESAGEMKDFDTSLLNTCLKFVDPFDKNLKFDLSSTKSYALKYDEEEILRNTEGDLHRLIFQNEKKYETKVEVAYLGRRLYTWDSKTVREKPYNGEKIFVNYKRFGRYIEFGDEPFYFFRSIIVNGLVQIAVDGTFLEIYVVKGFVRDDERMREASQPVKSVEEYFKSLSTGNEKFRFYNFETHNTK